MLAVVDRLVTDYADSISAGTVARCVRSCLDDLAGSALTDGLPEIVERLARCRLDQAIELQTMPVQSQDLTLLEVPA